MLELIIIFGIFFVVGFLISRAIRGHYDRKHQYTMNDVPKYRYEPSHPSYYDDAAESSKGSPVKDKYDTERYDSDGKRIV